MKRNLLRAAVAALAFAILPANAPAARAADIVDALGRKVTVATPVQRVVLNFNFEEFTAVAGVAGWDRVTWTALTTAREQIERAGIPIVVIDYNAQTLERHLASTRALGAVMGAEARAEELARLYEDETRDTMRRIAAAGATRKPRVLVELARDGAGTTGNSYAGTMWGRILDDIGADNIANGRLAGPWGPLAAEYVIAADPEFVFLAGSSWTNRPLAVRLGYDADEATTRRSLEPYARRVVASSAS